MSEKLRQKETDMPETRSMLVAGVQAATHARTHARTHAELITLDVFVHFADDKMSEKLISKENCVLRTFLSCDTHSQMFEFLPRVYNVTDQRKKLRDQFIMRSNRAPPSVEYILYFFISCATRVT